MDLGRPIGQNTTTSASGFDQGEHGAGIGLSGGHGHATSQNTQSGGQSGFNAGLGGEHASAGLPGSGQTPIADQFMGSTGSSGLKGEKLDNSLDHYSGTGTGASTGQYASNTGGSGRDAVSGAYEGRGTGDALTGQSHALRTGAGVGPMGENMSSSGGQGYDSQSQSHSHSHGSTALAGGAAGAAGGVAAMQHDKHSTSGSYGQGYDSQSSGITGASGGAGGHYSSESDRSGSTGTGTGAQSGTGSGGASGGGAGHYGQVQDDHPRGQPLTHAKEMDTGGPHSLVFQESTGQYVHRRDL